MLVRIAAVVVVDDAVALHPCVAIFEETDARGPRERHVIGISAARITAARVAIAAPAFAALMPPHGPMVPPAGARGGSPVNAHLADGPAGAAGMSRRRGGGWEGERCGDEDEFHDRLRG